MDSVDGMIDYTFPMKESRGTGAEKQEDIMRNDTSAREGKQRGFSSMTVNHKTVLVSTRIKDLKIHQFGFLQPQLCMPLLLRWLDDNSRMCLP